MVSWVNRRIFLISRIKDTIKKAKEEGKELDYEKLIAKLGGEGVARRTAREYLIACGFKNV